MASTKDQIRLLIRSIIREEVKNIVQEEVNLVLAEKFISTLAPAQRSLTETVIPQAQTKSRAPSPSYSPPRANKEELRKKILEKVGASENPMMAMIYGDDDIVSQQTPMKASNGFVAPASMPQQAPNGMVIDSDDEGIDISQFMGGR